MFMLFYKERISIHSPRMGRDRKFCLFFVASKVYTFQSTLPAWGETHRTGCQSRDL